ncbi:uncharacterized protein FMAN_10726 [Fusarium mangiferae]|uniref:Uncharacterized protein n=1 Tax=Fusarium mangiferae TaxID=192010 RepID=A0A1L7U3W9_FUSMA|nr:uncharacterized protein FMAN_10726 [Fusarium mangiferae]CVL05458.1 uncharacterized protein FMAN_10726 [Fusarium mangiferae]
MNGGLLYALLQKGADPNALESNGAFVLHPAATYRDNAAVIILGLLRYGAGSRTEQHDGTYVLYYLQVHWPSDLAKQLLGPGLNPEAGDENGRTPLVHRRTSISDDEEVTVFCVTRQKNVDVVAALLQHSPDPYHYDHSGRIILYNHAIVYNAKSYGSTITS